MTVLPTEAQEQITFVQWLELNKMAYWHTPNSTYTKSWKQKAMNKALGVQAGIPDLAVSLRSGGKGNLQTKFLMFIEMKRRTGATISPAQKQWIKTLNDCNNVFAVVAYGAEDAIYTVQRYEAAYEKLYPVYSSMQARCNNPDSHAYDAYGGRGITSEFDGFRDFFDWAMKNGYEEGLTVDRIDNDGNYSRSNCRLADRKQQANNRRSSVSITAYGKTKTLQQWADDTGIKRETIKRRINAGWAPEKAVTVVPVVGRNQNTVF